MGKLFGTDGIRGEANRYPMNAETAFAMGQAVVCILKKECARPRIMIGKDTRISGDMLESALASGIASMGGDACLLDVFPTPGIAFVARSLRADAGIVISASHNPYEDNGLKIFSGSGFKLSDAQENAIEELMLGDTLHTLAPPARDVGRISRIEDARGRYIVFAKNSFPRDVSIAGMKIVLDTANGATYHVAAEVFRELGAEVSVIHNTPNGININDNCGSQHTEDLRKKVVQSGAALGLAFDGDGDRLIAVDEKGQELSGDQILLICAKRLKDQGKLKNDLLVSTVMSNLGLRVACKRYGFRHHAAKVGDRYVLADMLTMGGVIGGEQSGHMIFLDHHTTGDGIIAALQLVAAMVGAGKSLSALAGMMDVFPQKLINVDVQRKPEIDTVPQLMDVIDRIEKELGEEGRVLVRYSGTQNMCRVMVEGPSETVTERCCSEIADVVKTVLG